ncbi:MAG: uridine kinase [Clostridia bacterium]|nr:uridine kinase [Clostridia bacterium]
MLIIGIAGGSGSGKSTIARRLVEEFGDKVTVLRHDDYYKAHHDITYEERTRINYDCPEAFDTDLMAEHLRLLREGRAVDCPVYDYTVHDRSDEVRRVEPNSVLIIDGILVLAEKQLRDLMDIKIFVDTDADVRIIRRIIRDVRDRQRTLESVVNQYLGTVKPMHEMYVEPSKKFADIIIPEGGRNIVALDMIKHRVNRELGISETSRRQSEK